MLRLKRVAIGFAGLLALCVQCQPGLAATPADYTAVQQGKIDQIDMGERILLIDDTSFRLGEDVVVKTLSGKIRRLSSLYPGLRVRVKATYSGRGGKIPVIHRIYLLK